jgi:hypothetical protein
MADALDLGREHRRDLGRAIVAAAGDPTEPFGLYAFPAAAPESELARTVERRVFDEWFGNSPELLDAEYGPYEDATLFLCVLDHRRGLPAGMIRLILPSPAGFKSLHDLEAGWDVRAPDACARTGIDPHPDEVLDVVTVAVDREYRGDAANGMISLALYQGVVQTARARGLRWLVTILDLAVLDLINGLTTAPFLRYRGVEPRSYLDSPASLPVYCDFEEYLPRLALADAAMYGILREAVGLEAAVRPVDLAPALDALAVVG